MEKGEQVDVSALSPNSSEVRVAGRLRAKRVMGKLAFMRLEDSTGPVQLYVDKAQLEVSCDQQARWRWR